MSLLVLDENITNALYTFGSSSLLLQYFSYALAAIFVYGIPVLLLWMFFSKSFHRISAAKIFILAIFTWRAVSNTLGEWIYATYNFRDRPFSFSGSTELFFEQPTKAFPSDHAAVLMVVTLALFAYRYPKIGWIFLAGTLVTSLGRVLVGFHYVGDILGGWVIGLLVFGVFWIFDKPLSNLIKRIFSQIKIRTDERDFTTI